jgi:hypothetical protein
MGWTEIEYYLKGTGGGGPCDSPESGLTDVSAEWCSTEGVSKPDDMPCP